MKNLLIKFIVILIPFSPIYIYGSEYYQIIAKHSNLCLDVKGESRENGVSIQQYRCHGGYNQLFQFKNGQIIAKHSGLCLDIRGNSGKKGALLQQYKCHGGNNQSFRFENGKIIAKHSNLCLDVWGHSTQSRALVQQYPCHGGKNQLWRKVYHHTSTIKILPLGDSITCIGSSYRYPLWKKVQGKDIDFIGNQKISCTSSSYKKVFDSDHEGHSGWRTDDILNNLDGWYHNPHIALIHLGTNDLLQGRGSLSARNNLEKIIIKLRNKNSNIQILLAKIIPMWKRNNDTHVWKRYNDMRVKNLNKLIEQLARSLNRINSPIVTVDMYSNFNFSDTYDGVHPNENGAEKMSQRWYDALVKNNFL